MTALPSNGGGLVVVLLFALAVSLVMLARDDWRPR